MESFGGALGDSLEKFEEKINTNAYTPIRNIENTENLLSSTKLTRSYPNTLLGRDSHYEVVLTGC